jgi:hypothetical protein
MNCPECANPVEKDAQFCPKCFARIEPPGFWKRFLCLFQSTGRPRRSIINIKKSVTIKTTDKDGQHHEYHSLEDVPPELRAEIEKLSSEALKEGFSSSVSDGPITKIVSNVHRAKAAVLMRKPALAHSHRLLQQKSFCLKQSSHGFRICPHAFIEQVVSTGPLPGS